MAQVPLVDAVTRRSVELFLERIKRDYSIAEVWLFGSRARGDARADSDADIAIVLNGATLRSMDSAIGMADAEFEVLLETGRLISALPVAVDQWSNPALHSNPYLIANIKREGIRW